MTTPLLRRFATAAAVLAAAVSQPGAAAPVTSGLQLHLDATDNGSLTTVLGSVSRWNDQTANNRDFQQLAPADQPVLLTDNFTKQNAVRFDGDLLGLIGATTPLGAGDDTFNYFVVWKPHIVANFPVVYEQGAGGFVNNTRAGFQQQGAGDYGFVGQNNDARFVPYTQGDWRVSSMAIDAGAANGTTIVENNGTFTTGNPNGGLNIGNITANVGANSAGTERFNGDIAEILVYDRVLNAAERTDTIDYLAAKHNLLGNALTGLDAIRHRWSFTTGPDQLVDSVGTADINNVQGAPDFVGDAVVLDNDDHMSSAFLDTTLHEKTLVAWVANTDLNQDGGAGVLGVQFGSGFGGVFDSIVWDEINPTDNNWMNGSNFFTRTNPADTGATETSTSEIMLAIVYNDDNSIDIYREGVLYDSFTVGTLQAYFGGDLSFANFGRRIREFGPEFDGILNEARIYGDALTADQIALLFQLGPDQLQAVVPEPSSLAALSFLALLLGYRRGRRKRS